MQPHDSTIRAVIFDWGGVLVDHPVPGLLAYFSRKLGVTPEQVNNAFGPFVDVFQKGRIAEHDLWEGVTAALGVKRPYDPSLWDDALRAVYRPKAEMFALVSLLKGHGYSIGLLSNTELPTVRFFHRQGYTQFDVAVFSCEEGIAKPERRIYEIALERLGAKPPDVVFIDDRVEFCRGAEKMGMHAVLFENPTQVRGALAALAITIRG
jgi:putative hydrolase of the HAD superfamily